MEITRTQIKRSFTSETKQRNLFKNRQNRNGRINPQINFSTYAMNKNAEVCFL